MLKEPMMTLISVFILSLDFSCFCAFYDTLLSAWLFFFITD